MSGEAFISRSVGAYLVRNLDFMLRDRNRACYAKVHYIDIPSSSVPHAVRNFLGLGDKLIPTQRLPSYRTIYKCIFEFRVATYRGIALADASNRKDPLHKLRRPFYRQLSSWLPKFEKVGSTVIDAVDAFSGELLNAFQIAKQNETKARGKFSNLGVADRWAISWLKEHDEFIDTPADKNLGTVLLPRSTYDTHLTRQLNTSFVELGFEDVMLVPAKAQRQITSTLSLALSHGILNNQQVDFAKSLFDCWSFPNGRLLMKIHKAELAARLITSGTKWVTNTISILLATTLQPCLECAESIAKDTRAVVTGIDNFNKDNTHGSIRIASFDVEQLYPSINQERQLLGFVR